MITPRQVFSLGTSLILGIGAVATDWLNPLSWGQTAIAAPSFPTPTLAQKQLTAAARTSSSAESLLKEAMETPVGYYGYSSSSRINPFPVYTPNLSPRQAPSAEESFIPPPRPGTVLADIQVRYVDRNGQPTIGRTRPYIITREFALQPGAVYRPELAQQGLQRVSDLDIVKQATLSFKPAAKPDQVVMVVNVVEGNSFAVVPGARAESPSVLQGPTLPEIVSTGANRTTGFSAGGSVRLRNLGGNDQSLALGLEGGENLFGADLTFTDPWIGNDPRRTGYAVNLFNRRWVPLMFTGGEREDERADEDEPWVHRSGGGVQFFRPLTPKLRAALGLSYQRVSVRDEAFSSDITPVDALGNPLTISDEGEDDLLTLNLAAVLDQRDDRQVPTRGSRLRFGVDQSIPVGSADILFSRLSANYTQYLPVSLFGFTEGPRTLVVNVQGGTVIGDLPPYEAFNLGGSNSVRGYGAGEVGSGRSFVQASAEYRFPITSLSVGRESIDVGGTLFVDYGTDLGSAETVTGEPAVVRNKPGSGLGYGVGLRATTPVGLVRLEFGLNDEGGSEVILNLGERF